MSSRWNSAFIGLVTVGLALAVIPGVAWADDERDAQTIFIEDIPDMLVGQTAPVVATSTSGLPVLLEINNGPCVLQPTAGGAPILAATGAGDCLVWASQPGDEQFEPAADVGRLVTFLASEADVRTVIPGADWIDAGQALPVFAEVSGEIGDDPVPTGTVRVTVKQSSGDVAATGEDDVDANGEALVTFPESLTATWPEGLYYVYASYEGDEGYHPAAAPPHPFFVHPAQDPDATRPNGQITVSPRDVHAGEKVAIDLQGLPSGAQGSVDYTVINPRRPSTPIKRSVPISGGEAPFAFAAGEPGGGGTFMVNARYLYYDDDETFRGTVAQSFYVRPSDTAMIDILPPYDRRVTEVKTNREDPVTVDVRVYADPGVVPSISLDPRSGCTATVVTRRDYTSILYRITVEEACEVTLAVPESVEWLANRRTFTIQVNRSVPPCPTTEADSSCRKT